MTTRTLTLYPNTPSAKAIILDKPSYSLGRAADCTIRLHSQKVSSQHASLVCTPHKATLIDLDSKNGTMVNGKKIRDVELKNGDAVQIADIDMLFQEEAQEQDGTTSRFRTMPSAPMEDDPVVAKTIAAMEELTASEKLSRQEAQHVAEELIAARRSSGRFESLFRILHNTLAEMHKPLLLECLLTEITGVLDLDHVGVYLADEKMFYCIENDDVVGQEKTERMSESVLEKVISSGKPMLIDNVISQNQSLGFESLMRLQIQSLLCIPVLDSASETIGVIYCVSKRTSHLMDLQKDRDFLVACSRVASLCLQNLSLIDQIGTAAHDDERKKQEGKFLPIVNKLSQEKENLALKAAVTENDRIFCLDHPSIQKVVTFVDRAASADLPVLLTGETGTGKSLWAREIHARSRPDKPFVVVDCTTLPRELIESELFGHEKGAFTGAISKKEGKVCAAKDGTLFIDEIGEMPISLQAKLLRLIQEKEYEAVGSTKTQICQARLVFATNRNLKQEMEQKNFRSDLYFRLNVLSFVLDPLRVAKDLILPMANHFLQQNREKVNPTVVEIDDKAAKVLFENPWPGNVRELENCVLRGLFNAQGNKLLASDLEIPEAYEIAQTYPDSAGSDDVLDLKQAREAVDKSLIKKALKKTGNNIAQAARELNLSRFGLIKLMKKYEM